MSTAATPEPAPIGNGQEVWREVVKDVEARVGFGKEKYGTTLRTFNGRDAANDAYQEALDMLIYLKQVQLEREFYRKALKRIVRQTASYKVHELTTGKKMADVWGIATRALAGKVWK